MSFRPTWVTVLDSASRNIFISVPKGFLLLRFVLQMLEIFIVLL